MGDGVVRVAALESDVPSDKALLDDSESSAATLPDVTAIVADPPLAAGAVIGVAAAEAAAGTLVGTATLGTGEAAGKLAAAGAELPVGGNAAPRDPVLAGSALRPFLPATW
jgi:hypothetical protein